MLLYELTYLISPKLEEEIEAFQKKIESLISKKAEILKRQGTNKINLAYPIQKTNKAFLAVLEFKAQAGEAGDLKKELEKEKGILRFLLIKKIEEKKVRKVRSIRKKTAIADKKVGLKSIDEELEKILR